eukprot:4016555-Amphidinium_carterae.1
MDSSPRHDGWTLAPSPSSCSLQGFATPIGAVASSERGQQHHFSTNEKTATLSQGTDVAARAGDSEAFFQLDGLEPSSPSVQSSEGKK